ncbi:hypothetical protein CW304_09265 [Bacillus sp. UFRGS-B20]|nr:hypothetical protein CW304_09265 [Bacillus sp. UFRGS-B20]
MYACSYRGSGGYDLVVMALVRLFKPGVSELTSEKFVLHEFKEFLQKVLIKRDLVRRLKTGEIDIWAGLIKS